MTLPFFYHLQAQADPQALIARLADAQSAADDGDNASWQDLVDELVHDVRNGKGVAAARDEALNFLAKAKVNLASFPDGVHKSSLVSLCDFVVQRSY